MNDIPGLVDVDTTLRLNKPELHVAIDRERAADLGVDASDIASSLRIMVGGDDEVSRYHDKQLAEEYDVEVRLKGADRGSSDTISKLYVPSTKTGNGASRQCGAVEREHVRISDRGAEPSAVRSAFAPMSRPATLLATACRRCSKRPKR